MSDYSFPFSSINGDRKYGASLWQAMFKGLFTNGIVPYSGNLAVTPGTGMNVSMSDGIAFIEGAIYVNDSAKTIPIDPADSSLDRIDRIILTRSLTNRNIVASVLKGTPDASPTAPELTQESSSDYEIAPVDVYVAAAVTSIDAGAITSNMLNSSVCGTATARTEFDLSTMQSQFESLLSTLQYDLEQVVIGAVLAHASTHASGGADAITPSAIGAESLTLVTSTKTSSYTILASDDRAKLSMSSSSDRTFTFTTQAVGNYPVGMTVFLKRLGTGAVTIAGSSGVIFQSSGNRMKIREQYGWVFVRRIADDAWEIVGDTGS